MAFSDTVGLVVKYGPAIFVTYVCSYLTHLTPAP